MRKLMFVVAMMCMTLTTNAQDVFNELLSSSLKVAEDESKDIETRKIATFKYDELNYMKQMVLPEVLKDTTDLVTMNRVIKQLNEQSYAMYQFVNLFFQRLASASKKDQKDIVISIFKAASINNPMFNDTDKDLVLAYYNNDNYITQFSLDTNWVKALEEVKKRER
ncbi:MAG: hypothetical protein IJK42_08930 [Prevotella sp.]|nr:hypothetical protein [Prevotella sp.]MBQ6209881.1 hypothetical protein [Prevotella sp.]